MTLAKLTIMGQIKKIGFRNVGEQQVCEVSVCKKRYHKCKTVEAKFDWFRINIWGKVPDFVSAKMAVGNVIGACGEFSVREWTDKDGNKKQNLEVKCSPFDIEIDGGNAPEATKAHDASTRKEAPETTDEPPF